MCAHVWGHLSTPEYVVARTDTGRSPLSLSYFCHEVLLNLELAALARPAVSQALGEPPVSLLSPMLGSQRYT